MKGCSVFVPLPIPLLKSDVDVPADTSLFSGTMFFLASLLGKTRIMGRDEGSTLCENI